MVNFYNTNHPENPIKETSRVLLTGELVNDDSVVELVQQEVEYTVELLPPVDKVVSDMPLHDFAANAGSILMKVAPEKEAGKDAAPRRNINLSRIARQLQNAKIASTPNKVIIASVAAFTGIVALAFGFLSQNQVQEEIAQAQEQLAQANAAYGAVRVALDASQSLQEDIDEVEAQVQIINANYASIQNSTDYVSDIAAITQSVPDGILFTTLEIDADWISICGRAYSSAPVVRFARNLELIGDFSKADIQRIDWANSTVGPSLSFIIMVAK